MQYPSKLIEEAVLQMAKLPGIGRKTALRLVLHLLREEEGYTQSLADALLAARLQIRYCRQCHNISDQEVCHICTSPRRDRSLLCVVEDTRNVMAIENTGQYQGLYHVLGGIISPMEGIGPGDLKVASLLARLGLAPDADLLAAAAHAATNGQEAATPLSLRNETPVEEVILALSPTMEGDTTAFYLTRKLKPAGVRITTIARGIPIGGDLEYADEITLGRSILSRTAMS